VYMYYMQCVTYATVDKTAAINVYEGGATRSEINTCGMDYPHLASRSTSWGDYYVYVLTICVGHSSQDICLLDNQG
jgi:hypothetical protein